MPVVLIQILPKPRYVFSGAPGQFRCVEGDWQGNGRAQQADVYSDGFAVAFRGAAVVGEGEGHCVIA